MPVYPTCIGAHIVRSATDQPAGAEGQIVHQRFRCENGNVKRGAELLQEGRAVVSLIFGEATPIQLMVRRDPEMGIEYLIAWILTDRPVSEAVDRLLELGDTWFNTRLEIVGDLLNFNLGRL